MYPRGSDNISQVLSVLIEVADEKSVNDMSYVWDIVTALRGPDDENHYPTLKRYTTARLRAIVGMTNEGGAIVNHEPLTTKEVNLRNSWLYGNYSSEHFSYHFNNAMYAAKQLGFEVPSAEMCF